jgi:DNA uptake protein ComE-like DNA-binding protein
VSGWHGLDFLSKQKTLPLPAAGIASRLGKVDLNKADKETLVAIPGIGRRLHAA